MHEQFAERCRLAVECGFELLQKKEGVWWEDDGHPMELPDRVRLRPLPEVGNDAFASVIARCMIGTLDRIDEVKVAEYGTRGWADIQLTDYVTPQDARSWVLVETWAGDPVGFVGLSACDEEATGTISHIGVVPEERGRGYVHELLVTLNVLARDRGFRGLLPDVDVLNVPMLAALELAGHHAGGRPWHRWS
ncbi:Acetyltransferase (GNAT) family protein [Modestobacter sp. DSM 44400]|uniref:GNAT family N-acetyltransferase n=1 Tax=Modestobacter sp. DSM 44400 TaxID=1550230 RepID=UPI00089D3963|nr:GNAT family N-acetyltransferase [Modestobacter sp. DSM 44400]SDY02173.1 Acetyltransferase (GNAT) family protein [Modestobacter sp. DSM 44400]